MLVKEGKRKVEAPFFLEPTTGRQYGIGQAETPYESVEFLWNHKNFWINLDYNSWPNSFDFNEAF